MKYFLNDQICSGVKIKYIKKSILLNLFWKNLKYHQPCLSDFDPSIPPSPASPQAPAPSQPTSWLPLAMSGGDRTRTQATTPRVTSPPTMSVCRCCSVIASWDSSWFLHNLAGTTTLWVYCFFIFSKIITQSYFFFVESSAKLESGLFSLQTYQLYTLVDSLNWDAIQ